MKPEVCYREIRGFLKGNLLLREPMHNHTSWQVGGPADVLAEPRDTDDLVNLLAYAGRQQIPVTVIGAGSNLLVGDGGIEGLVVKIAGFFADLKVNGDTITAGAGARLARLSAEARDAGLGGFEFAAGIPGTVGGALLMNAGANGQSMGEVVEGINCLDFQGRQVYLAGSQVTWQYRKSSLADQNLVVLEAVCRGTVRSLEDITSDMKSFLHSRQKTQPLDYPTCGSVFKNPPGQYAGKLIDEAGCRGRQWGGAQVSVKHANFIVNLGGARAADVLALIEEVQELVYKKFGVRLETEVRVLGRH